MTFVITFKIVNRRNANETVVDYYLILKSRKLYEQFI